MKPRILFCITICFIANIAFAQSKVNAFAHQIINKNRHSEKTMPLLVKGEISFIKQFTKENNGTFKSNAGNIASVSLPINKVANLLQSNQIYRIEYTPSFMHAFIDTMLIRNRIDSIQMPTPPMPAGIDGSGVIVGIIDIGMDYTHPDFMNDSLKTRFLYYWDQESSDAGSNVPQPYNYGRHWTKNQIDAGLCTSLEYRYSDHGTQVLGMACANGRTKPAYKAIAYKSDIIGVHVKQDSTFLNAFIDAAQYIFDYAEALNKPCVINSSVGDYGSGHDGRDLYSEYIDNLLTERNGRAIAQAAGNAGRIQLHTRHTSIANDTIFSWFKFSTNSAYLKAFQFVVDTTAISTYQFKLGIDSKVGYTNLGQSNWFTLSSLDLSSGSYYKLDSIMNGSAKTADYQVYIDKIYNAIYITIFFEPNFTDYQNYYCRFMSNGTAVLDSYSDFIVGLARVETAIPSSSIYPPITKYRTSDGTQNIVGYWNCSDKVITVANYMNKKGFTGVNGVYSSYPNTPGNIEPSSSVGPTRDGRMKPDISATGGVTVSTINHLNWLNAYSLRDTVSLDSSQYHAANGGTSMAAPVVTGTLALYLQLKPNASVSEMKNAVITNAYRDNFTPTLLPTSKWGYGKLNGFQTVLDAITLGCTNPMAGNYNANANVDDGSCMFVGINEENNSFLQVHIIPNPFESNVIIDIQLKNEGKYFVELFDIFGKKIIDKTIFANNKIVLNMQNEPSGMYLVQIKNENKLVYSNKIIKQ